MRTQLRPRNTTAVDEFIEKVKDRMETTGTTMSALARDAAISRPYLYRILDGTQVPTLEVAETIASKLGLSLRVVNAKKS